MQFSAWVFGIILFVLIFLTRLTPLALAQTTNPYGSLMKTDPSVSTNIETLSQGVFMGLLSSLTCTVAGIDFTTQNNQCLAYNLKTQTFSYAPKTTTGGGLIGLALGGVALTFHNPINTSDYFQYLSENFGLIKQAHAANGIGFAQLSPITNLWLAFRNLSYLLFVIIFVVVGFAIMLRAKIDPRTVMTVENQIPKLIVALLLITFSYAIAGFIIDIMWVAIYFAINLFTQLDPTVLGKQTGSITASVTSNPYGFLNGFYGKGGFLGLPFQAAQGVGQISDVIIKGVLSAIQPLVDILAFFFYTPAWLGCLIASAFPGAPSFAQCINTSLATLPAVISGIVAFLIFAIALLIAVAKLWWQLIKAYTLFLIFAIFGPIIIMSGVLPGSKTNFEYWLRHLLAYAIVFPTAIGIFLLGKTLMDVYSSAPTGSLQVPPLIGIPSDAYAFLGVLIGFAVVMLAPQSLTMVQDALNAQDPKYLAGIGQAIGAGSQAFGAFAGKTVQRSFRESDPLKGLDEGWLRKLAMPQNSLRRKIFYGNELKKKP